MAMKNCFQVNWVSTTTTTVCRPFASVQKRQLPSRKGLHLSNTNVSLSSRSQNSNLGCKAREAVDAVQVATDSSWDAVIAGETPVLVEFWAPWCGPCKMIAPVIEELAKEYAEKIACYKVNTDDCPNIATEFGIRSIPTLLFFKKGEKKESVIGAVQKHLI